MANKQDGIELSIIKVKKKKSKGKKSPISKQYSNYLRNKKSDDHKRKGKDIADIKINVIKRNTKSSNSEPVKKPEAVNKPEPKSVKSEPVKKPEPKSVKSEPVKKPEPVNKPEPKSVKSEPVKKPEPVNKPKPIKKPEPKSVKSEPVKKPEPKPVKSESKKRVVRRKSKAQIRVKRPSIKHSKKNRITRSKNRASRRRPNNKGRRVSFRCYPQNKKKDLNSVIDKVNTMSDDSIKKELLKEGIEIKSNKQQLLKDIYMFSAMGGIKIRKE